LLSLKTNLLPLDSKAKEENLNKILTNRIKRIFYFHKIESLNRKMTQYEAFYDGHSPCGLFKRKGNGYLHRLKVVDEIQNVHLKMTSIKIGTEISS
jgi:hypothetical protein